MMTARFVTTRSYPVYPLEWLYEAGYPRGQAIACSGGKRSLPVGYVLATVKPNLLCSYEEEQLFLVLDDTSAFGLRVPITLGTPTLERVMNVLTESELEALTTRHELRPWRLARTALMMASCRANLEGEEGELDRNIANKPLNLIDLKEVVRTRQREVIPPHSTVHLRGLMDFMMMGARAQVMTSKLCGEHQDPFPHGVRVESCMTELHNGSKKVAVIVRNLTSRPCTIKKSVPIAWCEWVEPDMAKVDPSTINELDQRDLDIDDPAIFRPKMKSDERERKLMDLLDTSGLKSWTPRNRERMLDTLRKYHDIFALEPGELGHAKSVKHEITLLQGDVHKERFRRIPPHLLDEVRTAVQDMLKSGAIRPSKSPWCNAVVLARKKGGELRVCIDFRALNAKTKKDAFPLPRITESLENLRGAAYFSCLDMKSGFWQVELEEESKAYTAFTVGNLGFYECERMPFGLTNAPATFQRLMQSCLGEQNMDYCLIYLDDIVIYSRTQESHIWRVDRIFERLRAEGLKLRPDKCDFFKSEITYLGHEVSAEGVKPSNFNLKAVAQFAPPSTFTAVRQFVGLASHYRRFIKGFAKIARPLTDLTSGENASKHQQPCTLTEDELNAFNTLKTQLMAAPVLGFADLSQPFLLETDASQEALGAVLSQRGEDKRWHPVAYASRCTNAAERRYHSGKLEFLALKWAVTEQFKDYLIAQRFEVKTDNNPLTYVMTNPNLDACGHRWVAAMAPFNFSIKYLKGKENKAADALSRYTSYLPAEEVSALLDGVRHGGPIRSEAIGVQVGHEAGEESQPLTETTAGESTPEVISKRAVLKSIPEPDWVASQKKDPFISRVRSWLAQSRGHSAVRTPLRTALGDLAQCPDGRAYCRESANFVLFSGLLYRTHPDSKDDIYPTHQFVVPESLRAEALDGCHDQAGHQGQNRTIALLRDRFWWPGLETAARARCADCKRCIQNEGKQVRAPMQSVHAALPLDLLHLDFTKIEIGKQTSRKKKTVDVLVVADHFTRYLMAFDIPDTKAETVARVLHSRVFSVYGLPKKIMTDQALVWKSRLFAELCAVTGAKHLRTSAYHPQTNGQVERAHRTLFRMIGKLTPEQKLDWRLHLPSLVFAYNATRSPITGYSPYFLWRGQPPRLAVDMAFPTWPQCGGARKYTEYVANLKLSLRSAVEEATTAMSKESARQRRNYDKRSKTHELAEGDVVLVRGNVFVGKRKIGDQWIHTRHEVVRALSPGSPTYVVRNMDTGKELVRHRNQLFQLSVSQESEYSPAEVSDPPLATEPDKPECGPQARAASVPFGGEEGTSVDPEPLEVVPPPAENASAPWTARCARELRAVVRGLGMIPGPYLDEVG